MIKYDRYPGLPRMEYEVLDADALLAAAAQGEWFEQTFINPPILLLERGYWLYYKQMQND